MFHKIFSDFNLIPFLRHINDNFEEVYIADEQSLSNKEKEDNAIESLDQLQYWLKTMELFIDGKAGKSDIERLELTQNAIDRFLLGDPYFISQDKDVLMIIIEPNFSFMDIEKCVESTDKMQMMLDEMSFKYPNVLAGLTGTIPLARDEMVYAEEDMLIASILSLTLVLLLFILIFHTISAPLLAGLNLIIAIIFATGVGALFLDSLNIMTSMFAAILIGLGIDYSIHIISIYYERRSLGEEQIKAMQNTLVSSGGGIITGALTTAIAFFTLMISDSRGFKEMGLILGLGIICAMLTTLLGLPAFLIGWEKVLKRFHKKASIPKHIEFKTLGAFGEKVYQNPILFLFIGFLLLIFFVYQALNVGFDYNYLNMEPKGIPSVVLQDTLINAFQLSPDNVMLTVSSIEEADAMVEKAKGISSVSIVQSLSNYLPPTTKQAKRRPYIEQIREYTEEADEIKSIEIEQIAELLEQIERLDMNIYEMSQLAFLGGQDRVDKKCKELIGDPEDENSQSEIILLFEKIEENQKSALEGLNNFQKLYIPLLEKQVYNMANTEEITLEKVPEKIKNRFLNENNEEILVLIFPKEQIWNLEFLRHFKNQMELLNPKITGTPLMFLRLIDYLGRDGRVATMLTLIVVFILLWIDFGSLKYSLIAMIPLVIGGVWMVGLLHTLGLTFNIVNVMGIPMIVGIGIDDGVHLFHRYKVEGFDKSRKVLASTGKAILLTSLTTMIGFGSLMIAKYRGFFSLGALLVLGVGMCFITTVLFLPALLGIGKRKEKS